MKPEDKTTKIIKAVAEKHEASRKITEYIVEEDYCKKADKSIVIFKKGTKMKLTAIAYEEITSKKDVKLKKV